MKLKLQSYQSFSFLSQGPAMQNQKTSKSPIKKLIDSRNLLNEHQQLSAVQNLVYVKDKSRFDRELSKDELKIMINQVETEEERKK